MGQIQLVFRYVVFRVLEVGDVEVRCVAFFARSELRALVFLSLQKFGSFDRRFYPRMFVLHLLQVEVELRNLGRCILGVHSEVERPLSYCGA